MTITEDSLGDKNTVIIEFETGHKFKVPNNMSVGELSAHLLTPEITSPL
ncbi:MAG: hypothetical protein K0B02_01430 [DPANN group archaeon]|nr:hypothetical protein [DPANN group archaeon]